MLRWGGDEFVGVFSGLNDEDSVSFSKKLLHAVSNLDIDAGANKLGLPYP
ncbi:hypothetical protein MASR2M29_19860 [Spirochaetota bacterium]